MNYVDIIVIILLVVTGVTGYFRGATREAGDLIVFTLSIWLSAMFFHFLFQFIPPLTIIPTPFLLSISFFCLFFVFILSLYTITVLIQNRFPIAALESPWNSYLGPIPALVKATIFILLLIPVLTLMPLTGKYAEALRQSFAVRTVSPVSKYVENWIQDNFSEAGSGKTTFTTLSDSKTGTVDLGFTVSQPGSDDEASMRLLGLADADRAKNGADKLVWNADLAKVALAQAKEMAAGGKLTHLSKADKDYTERIAASGVQSGFCGELIAVAESADAVNYGFANNDKDQTILDSPEFSQMGAVVVDLGKHGVLVVEEFSELGAK